MAHIDGYESQDAKADSISIAVERAMGVLHADLVKLMREVKLHAINTQLVESMRVICKRIVEQEVQAARIKMRFELEEARRGFDEAMRERGNRLDLTVKALRVSMMRIDRLTDEKRKLRAKLRKAPK